MTETQTQAERTTTRRVPLLKFVTIPEIARRRGVSRPAVLYAIRRGILRAYRVAGRREWFVTRTDADAYVDAPVRGRRPAVVTI